MHSYFLSDLHLTQERPDISKAFMQFLQTQAASAQSVYILGDLFEYWIGDDAAPLIGAQPILQALKQLSQHCDTYFVAGNRDFLAGRQFSQETGFTILEDETVIDLYGTPTLILHGDSLCTDDHAHQQFRQQMVTNTEWKNQFLSQTIEQRIEQAKQAREQSMQHKQSVSMQIMDVNEQAVLEALDKHNVTQMIHGHTHRQNTHYYEVNGQTLSRIVLGDWDKTSSILTADKDGLSIANEAITQ